jgi:hypothetical protein
MSRSELSADHNCVILDLDVAPPEEKTDQVVYIGSAQVCGKDRGEFQAATAGCDQSDPVKLLA